MDREIDKGPEKKSDTALDSEELDEVSGGGSAERTYHEPTYQTE